MWNFFTHVFRARLKTALSPSFWAAFFLLPVLIVSLGIIFNQQSGLVIRAGVLENNSPVASRIIKGIQYYSRDNCEIVFYTDEAQMRQDVAAHRLECAYVLTSAVEERADRNAIITYRSPMTVTDKVLDLMVAAAYLETMAGELGVSVLSPFAADMAASGEEQASGSMDTETQANVAADIQARADEYLRDGMLMEMVLIEAGRTAEDNAYAAPYRRLFHGLTGLFAWLLSLMCAMGLAGATEKTVLERIQSTGRGGGVYMLAGFGAVFVAAGLFLIVTVAAGGWVYPGLTAGGQAEWLMGGALALALAGTSVLLSVCVRTDAFPAVISFIFIFAALLGGTFFDIREVLASVSFLRLFFLNHFYLEGISRAAIHMPWMQAGILAGAGLVSCGLAWLATRRKIK